MLPIWAILGLIIVGLFMLCVGGICSWIAHFYDRYWSREAVAFLLVAVFGGLMFSFGCRQAYLSEQQDSNQHDMWVSHCRNSGGVPVAGRCLDSSVVIR